MKKVNSKNFKSPKKYALGDFVIKNQQGINAGVTGLGAVGGLTKDPTISGITSGLATGASIGSIVPGIGTVIGAGVGGLLGGIFGNKQKKAKKNALEKERLTQAGLVADQFESDLDIYNENSYGVYEDGGDVSNDLINIEKGELQVDPESGKILRKYSGINPETGGKYEPHAKSGKDTNHNLVSAKEGTFIITAKEASKYEKAVENNDKLAQNTTMSNIRNLKNKSSLNTRKFAIGGDINRIGIPDPFTGLQGVTPNLTPAIPNIMPKLGVNATSNIVAPTRQPNSILANGLNYIPALANIFQGSKTPNYLNYKPTRMNVGARQQTLANMPTEVSVNPVLNELRGDAYSIDKDILNSTNNPSVSRALRLQTKANLGKAVNNAFVNNTNLNTDIKTRRASIYDNINQQDTSRNAQNAGMMLGVDNTNREMDVAKMAQTNYGLSQLQQMYQTLQSNKNKSSKDMQMLQLLEQIFPNAKGVFSGYKKGGTNG